MRHFNSSVNSSNLVDSLDLGAETSVHTEDFSINDGSNGKVVKDLSAVFPRIGVTVLSIDLIIKTIDGCDLSGLVIASEESDPVWILDLQTQQILECFN